MKTRITIAIIALLLAISPVMPAFAAVTAPDLGKFAGETVTSVYSFDYAARTYQLVSDAAEAKKIVTSIPGVPVQTSGKATDKNAVGFLIFTEKGKYPIYLPSSLAGKDPVDDRKEQLIELSKSCNKKYTRHMQWFVYMSPENIERITFSAQGGGNFYSLDPAKNRKEVGIALDTNDPATFRIICEYLKGIAVEPAQKIFPAEKNSGINPTTTMDLLNLEIQFKSGVVYRCFSNMNLAHPGKDGLVIGATGQNEQLVYQLDTRGMRDFMMTVPGVKLYSDFS